MLDPFETARASRQTLYSAWSWNVRMGSFVLEVIQPGKNITLYTGIESREEISGPYGLKSTTTYIDAKRTQPSLA